QRHYQRRRCHRCHWQRQHHKRLTHCRLARGGEQPKSADQQRGRARSRPQGRLLLLRAGDLGRRMAGAVLGLTETATDTFLLQMTYLKC
uniref:Uncharacterized protein n=1 Tax=Aegilops tauschii subsp. strangulata TaxID=200361 RepID=A0A452YX92_AEGTS